VTGARVKIGYQAALKMLRAGARVIATTRFPGDAGQAEQLADPTRFFAPRRIEVGVTLRPEKAK